MFGDIPSSRCLEGSTGGEGTKITLRASSCLRLGIWCLQILGNLELDLSEAVYAAGPTLLEIHVSEEATDYCYSLICNCFLEAIQKKKSNLSSIGIHFNIIWMVLDIYSEFFSSLCIFIYFNWSSENIKSSHHRSFTSIFCGQILSYYKILREKQIAIKVSYDPIVRTPYWKTSLY